MNLFDGRIEDGCFVGTVGRVALGPDVAAPAGSLVTLGARAEDITLAAENEPDALSGRVLVREPVGSDVFLTLESGGEKLVLRAPPDCPHNRGDAVRWRINAARAHLFDAATRTSLR
jgi:ABC-type sugar transport system ATPase subunit